MRPSILAPSAPSKGTSITTLIPEDPDLTELEHEFESADLHPIPVGSNTPDPNTPDPNTPEPPPLGSASDLGLPADFARIVQRHVDGFATDTDEAVLRLHRTPWIRQLLRLLDDVEECIDRARDHVPGAHRAQVLADFQTERDRIDVLLTGMLGPASNQMTRGAGQVDAPDEIQVEGVVQLQLSWMPGRVVAWAAGLNAPSEAVEGILVRLEQAGVSRRGWEQFQPIRLEDGTKIETVAIPLTSVLGWLAALGRTAADPTLGASVTWLGLISSQAVQLVAQGRIIPKLRHQSRDNERKGDRGGFEVKWLPALVETSDIVSLSNSLPIAVTALRNRQDARAFSQAVLADIVDTIVSTAVERLEVPAPPPSPTSRADVAESFLAHLNGSPFDVPSRHGVDLARRIDQWTDPIAGAANSKLMLDLKAPDSGGAWHLAVLAPVQTGGHEPVETALVNASNTKRKETKDQLSRLEVLYPPLLRPGGRRRGEVVLSQDEAWHLMTTVGDTLIAAGFEVRAPALSRKKPTPALRLTSDEAQESVVGARQLANVRWSVVFDDIELTASQIAELALQARPLVQSRGQWVELDKVDLAAAAQALAERADRTRLSGADMLRHALGLEGSPLVGGISIAGEGWAADLLRSARDIPDELPTRPEGFHGELRSYQAEARAWLSFLDGAGLGGCLALDMGLGKTPTMLAHLRASAETGTALVIAPPAVVGNWANEARKFVPDLKVTVHHGQSRAAGAGQIARLVERYDIVITTYGTAVRDIDEFAQVQWGKVILDEAQAIKNPTSDTARQLRRLNARSRVALTGTPIENGLGDLWAIIDFTNPGLVGGRAHFISQLSPSGTGKDGAESALRALNGILVFRRTKAEPAIAAELPDRIDELDRCSMTPEQIGLYQAVLDNLVQVTSGADGADRQKGAVLAAITALKQICNHPVNYQDDRQPLEGRSGKLARLNEIVDNVFVAGERLLIFTHFASWGEKLAKYMTERTGVKIDCYHGGLARGARDRMVEDFQNGKGAGALVLSLKAGGTGLNLTAASHVVLYDRWWNPAVEDQARDRVWRIGQKSTVICHRLVCPGTVDERVEEVVAGKRQVADMVLPKSSSIEDLDVSQLRAALGIDPEALLLMEDELLEAELRDEEAAHAPVGHSEEAVMA